MPRPAVPFAIAAALLTTSALAQEAPLLSLPGLEAQPLSLVSDAALANTLEELRAAGIVPGDVLYPIVDVPTPLVAVPLSDPERVSDLLILYFSPPQREHFLLRVTSNHEGGPEARLRSARGAELVLTAQGVRLERAGATGVADALDCIARSLGVGVDTSSLGRLLASATCTATTLNTLVLTAYNCLSVPHPIATIGCINGIAKLISCGLVNCQPPAECFAAIEFGGTVNGSWSTSCPSVHRRSRFAHYYTFTLAATARVEINLSSSSVDPYLYLLQGEGSNGRIITRDNDSGPGRDSRISRTLSPGTYTIEATTDRAGATGSFVLSLKR